MGLFRESCHALPHACVASFGQTRRMLPTDAPWYKPYIEYGILIYVHTCAHSHIEYGILIYIHTRAHTHTRTHACVMCSHIYIQQKSLGGGP
jgi:hypothetical protein